MTRLFMPFFRGAGRFFGGFISAIVLLLIIVLLFSPVFLVLLVEIYGMNAKDALILLMIWLLGLVLWKGVDHAKVPRTLECQIEKCDRRFRAVTARDQHRRDKHGNN